MNNDQRNFEQFMKQRDEVARAYVNGEASTPSLFSPPNRSLLLSSLTFEAASSYDWMSDPFLLTSQLRRD
jgi:hypothetical protein